MKRIACVVAGVLLAAEVVAAPSDPAGLARRIDAPQTISVEVRGPLALVQIDRPVELGRAYGTRNSDEVILDLALPPGARLQDAELRGGDEGARVRLRPRVDGVAGYERMIAHAEWRRARDNRGDNDDGADFRLRIAGARMGDGRRAAPIRLRASYVAPLACQDGRLVLDFPASLDAAPAPAEVRVGIDLGPGAPGIVQLSIGGVDQLQKPRGPRLTASPVSVPTAGPWQIAIAPKPRQAAAATGGVSAVALTAVTAANGQNVGTAVTVICRDSLAAAPADASTPPPERVVFLIDRSRSMGPEGVAAAGSLSRALALGLPPGTRFSAVLFDRDPEALFPVLRAPTHEALAALETAASASQLRNGTRLGPALDRARALIEVDDRDGRSVRSRGRSALVVLLTDAAFPDDHDVASLRASLSTPAFAAAQFAAIILRGAGEERPAPFALKTLAALAAHRGGLLREVAVVGAADHAGELLAALRAGGDLLNLRARPTPSLRDLTFDQLAVAPRAGSFGLGHWRGRSDDAAAAPSLSFEGSMDGQPVRLRAAVSLIDVAWAEGVAALALAPRALPPLVVLPEPGPTLATSDGGVAAEPLAAVLAPPAQPEAAAPDRRRGQLDREVLHRALTYTFLPRARACYLARPARSAADFQLAGRLRLELQIERGEMLNAVIARSSLGKPQIEACLREAAFTVDIPRPVLNDAPSIAAFNLVFRPRTDLEAPKRDGGAALDDTLAKILGPQGPAGDPLELLIESPPQPEPAPVGRP